MFRNTLTGNYYYSLFFQIYIVSFQSVDNKTKIHDLLSCIYLTNINLITSFTIVNRSVTTQLRASTTMKASSLLLLLTIFCVIARFQSSANTDLDCSKKGEEVSSLENYSSTYLTIILYCNIILVHATQIIYRVSHEEVASCALFCHIL